MKTITVNEFLAREVNCCFVCQNPKYREFYFRGHLYRVCFNCLKKPNVQEFFNNANFN